MKLFYVILGATPLGRTIEQHDVFFGIAETIKDLIPEMKKFWPEAKGKIHVDCYKEVKFVDGFELKIIPKDDSKKSIENLFFINVGGYKREVFEELHEQHLMVGEKMSGIIKRVKKTDFYKTMGFPEAVSHIDDKHGVDIDDIYKVNDLLPQFMKDKYSIVLVKSEDKNQENRTFVGYFKLSKLI